LENIKALHGLVWEKKQTQYDFVHIQTLRCTFLLFVLLMFKFFRFVYAYRKIYLIKILHGQKC